MGELILPFFLQNNKIMAKTPFKLRSGNSTPYKKMGSSPVRSLGLFEGGFAGPDPGAGLKAHWDNTMGAYFKNRRARKKQAAESYK